MESAVRRDFGSVLLILQNWNFIAFLFLLLVFTLTMTKLTRPRMQLSTKHLLAVEQFTKGTSTVSLRWIADVSMKHKGAYMAGNI
jgi:hypothetical protein